MSRIKKLKFRDPMIAVLCALLVFLMMGTAWAGCIGKKTIKIELDAAYGGDNTGYAGIINESDFTQAQVDALTEVLNEDGHFAVLLTHESGKSASVAERAEKIKTDKPAAVLSIHAGGTPDASITGMSVYADIPTMKTNSDSLNTGTAVQKAFTSDSWTPTLGYLYYTPLGDDYQLTKVDAKDTKDYKLDTWEMMEKIDDIPVVIVDQIHVSNQSDVDTWANKKGYKKAAKLYCQALKDAYGIND
jgi:N-acetylmuramoyl-L-alanine amidase